MLGLAGSADYAPGTVVASRDGRFKTSDSDYWGGLRARVPFGVGDAAATLAFGRQAALLEGTDGSNRAMLSAPDVRYSYLRAGADVQLNVPGGLGIRAGAAYRSVSGAGSEPSDAQSAMFFPRLTVTGLDASAAVAYRFLGVLEGRLGFDVRRYRLDTHAMLGDRLPVSGALDQYLSFWLSLAVLVDGVADGF